jgi:hypothetical protein
MPSPKSGKPGKALTPTAPKQPEEADNADPGQVAEIKAEQQKIKAGKYGSTPANPFKPPPAPTATPRAATTQADTTQQEERPTGWIEVELVGEDGEPIAGEKYRITLPDNTVDEGTLDQNGWVRVEGFEPGNCKITFPELDAEAWESIESGGPRS